MGVSRARRHRAFLWPALLVVPLLASGCQDVQPTHAKGLDLHRLSSVSLGMSHADLVALMGQPLEEAKAPEPAGQSAVWYARPGARWILGEYRTNVRGYEVVFWLRDGHLVAGRVVGAPNGPLCECRADACNPDWATPCVATLDGGLDTSRRTRG